MTPLIVLLVVGLILAAFSAMAETAVTSVSRIRLRSLAEEQGNVRARRLLKLHEQPNGYLATILTINTVAVILASSSVTLLVVRYLHRIPASEALGTIVLSIFVLTFCEIVPKSLALHFNERLALALSRPVAFLTVVLRPIVGGLTAVGTLFVRIAMRGKPVTGPFMTEDELKVLLEVGEQDGIVQEEERAMIHGILDMTDKAVRECMVPRVDVVSIESDRGVSDLISLIIEYGHSRIPIYEETIDNVVGVVYAKDLLQRGIRSDTDIQLKDISRPPYFTPDSKHVGELLHDMQSRSVHIAIVVDEYGGMAGIITIEDVIEEIVGPIRDEYDALEIEDIQQLSETEALINPRMPLSELREQLNIDIEIGVVDADSIGGIVYERLGEIPKAGDRVTLGSAVLTVESVQRQSIQKLRISSELPLFPDKTAATEDHDEEEHGGTGAAPLNAAPDPIDGPDVAENAAETHQREGGQSRSAGSPHGGVVHPQILGDRQPHQEDASSSQRDYGKD